MRTSFAVIAALFASTAAVQLEQKNSAVGIFSKLMEQEEAQNAVTRDLQEAREAKRIQLIEAEKEHEAAVAEEEKEDADKMAKEQEEMEVRMEEKKRQDQIKQHEALFKQVMDEQNLQMDERVRIARPMRRHNHNHAADLMLINLSVEEPEDATSEQIETKPDDSAAAAPQAKKDDSAEEGAAEKSAAKSTELSPNAKIMKDFEQSKEKVRLSRMPAEEVDPRFADQEDKMEANTKPSEERPGLNSPADVDPYWRAVEGVRNDKMPGSADLAITKNANSGQLPLKAFPKYNYNAQPRQHARPTEEHRFYDNELPKFDKSEHSRKTSSVKGAVSNEPEDPTSQDLRDAAKAKLNSDALDVKAAGTSSKGDDAAASTPKESGSTAEAAVSTK